MANLIFVYGTLRQGGSRPIPQLFPSANFVGFGTVRGWLYHFGAYPGLVLDPLGRGIVGEVYAVDVQAIAEMDGIERYIEGDPQECYYFRRAHTVALREGSTIMAELYEVNPHFYDCTTPLDATDWICWAQAQADLPQEELWPDGTPVKK